MTSPSPPTRTPLPRRSIPQGPELAAVRGQLFQHQLHTVCEEALCPNRTECWAQGSLAFQILGSICTRRCGFCAETTGRPGAVDPAEPRRLAQAAQALRLKHVVITSPARDDLPDQGADAFVAVIQALHGLSPRPRVEVLVPDFNGHPDLINRVLRAQPDVFNHNIETVRRLNPKVRPRADYDTSLAVLAQSAQAGLLTKSGLMVGLGESREEIDATLKDLAQAGVRWLTLGQYAPPSPQHWPLHKIYLREEFDSIRHRASDLFPRAQVGPLVRSSYHAGVKGDGRVRGVGMGVD